jgi:hypothetical protein
VLVASCLWWGAAGGSGASTRTTAGSEDGGDCVRPDEGDWRRVIDCSPWMVEIVGTGGGGKVVVRVGHMEGEAAGAAPRQGVQSRGQGRGPRSGSAWRRRCVREARGAGHGAKEAREAMSGGGDQDGGARRRVAATGRASWRLTR